jgi:hypothetical protein
VRRPQAVRTGAGAGIDEPWNHVPLELRAGMRLARASVTETLGGQGHWQEGNHPAKIRDHGSHTEGGLGNRHQLTSEVSSLTIESQYRRAFKNIAIIPEKGRYMSHATVTHSTLA